MNFVKQKAIYMQIADYVLENILSETFKAGDRLQSIREMAATVQVNPNTVTRSFNYLQDEGIIFNKRGIGFFVADDAPQKTRDIKKQAFIDDYLPQFFKMMDLLGLNFDELEALYNEKKERN